jgi:hypothetical protein
MKNRGSRRPHGLFSMLVAAALAAAPAAAHAKTTVHTYSYNVDGALTAVTTQVDDQAATTTYLTWDDFTPDASDPTTGTVSVGDGRLVGFGPSPGNQAQVHAGYVVDEIEAEGRIVTEVPYRVDLPDASSRRRKS